MAGKSPKINKEEPDILWQDSHIAVISKGPGWVCAVSRDIEQNKILGRLRAKDDRDVKTLVNSGKVEHLAVYVMMKYKEETGFELAQKEQYEFGIAHRLDVDTSGSLLLGKTLGGFNHLRNLFNQHLVYKEYICLVHNSVKHQSKTVDLPIYWDPVNNVSYICHERGTWARSIYTVMGRYRLKGGRQIFTLCRVVIITGRTHQIRIHMASIGHPLVSDSKYNHRLSKTDLLWCPRMFLHAWRVGFYTVTDEWREVKAPLTKDLNNALRPLQEIKVDAGNEQNPAIRVLNSSQLGPEQKIRIADQENVPPAGNAQGQPPGDWSQAIKENKPAGAGDDWSQEFAQRLQRPYGPEPAGPPPPPPPPPPAGGPYSFNPNRRGQVTLPSGETLKIPDYAPPPPPPPPPVMGPDGPIGSFGGIGAGSSLGEEAPTGQNEMTPEDRVSAAEWLNASIDEEEPAPGGTAVADPISVAGDVDQISGASPTAPASVSPAIASPKDSPPSSSSKGKAAKKQAKGQSQHELEEICCDLMIRALLNYPGCQSLVGTLGNEKEVISVLHQMGQKRPKLSKLLRDRPETFVFLENKGGEPLVTLSQRAMALGRLEQVSNLKMSTDVSAAEATQKAKAQRERVKQKEEKLKKEVPEERRAPTRRWNVAERSYPEYEEKAGQLVEMGFDRDRAFQALHANSGDMMEAMDMLSNMPSIYAAQKDEANLQACPTCGEQCDMKKRFCASCGVDLTQAAEQKSEQSQPPPAKAGANEKTDDEEAQFEKALAESKREEETRMKEQEWDAASLEAVIAESLKASSNEDEELLKALELSQREEEEKKVQRKMDEKREEEELERAMKESARMYEELFFASTTEAWENVLQQSRTDAGPDEEDSEQFKHYQQLYNETYEDFEDEEAVWYNAMGSHASSPNQGPAPEPLCPGQASSSSTTAAQSSGGAASSSSAANDGAASSSRGWGTWFGQSSGPSKAASDTARSVSPDAHGWKTPPETEGGTEGLACADSPLSGLPLAGGQEFDTRQLDRVASGKAACSSWDPTAGELDNSSSGVATGEISLQDWTYVRMDELGISFDRDVLWSVLNELSDEDLGNEEVLKMWLGLSETDKLPHEITVLVTELRQQKRLLQFAAR